MPSSHDGRLEPKELVRVDTIYNTSYHSSTTFSPLDLLYLREDRISIDLVTETMTEMRSRMEQAFQTVRDQLCQAFQRTKQAYDGRVKKLQFNVDNLVWFCCPEDGLAWDRSGNY